MKEKRGKIVALNAAGYEEKESRKREDDEYDFDETVCYARWGHTKAEIEENFDELERRHMEEVRLSGAAIDKWQKEGVIDHDL